jgi:hypothetical protein
MSMLGIALVLFGVLVIGAPLGWMGLNKLQSISDDRYRGQQKKLQAKK